MRVVPDTIRKKVNNETLRVLGRIACSVLYLTSIPASKVINMMLSVLITGAAPLNMVWSTIPVTGPSKAPNNSNQIISGICVYL